jgi:hypothetical protein
MMCFMVCESSMAQVDLNYWWPILTCWKPVLQKYIQGNSGGVLQTLWLASSNSFGHIKSTKVCQIRKVLSTHGRSAYLTITPVFFIVAGGWSLCEWGEFEGRLMALPEVLTRHCEKFQTSGYLGRYLNPIPPEDKSEALLYEQTRWIIKGFHRQGTE